MFHLIWIFLFVFYRFIFLSIQMMILPVITFNHIMAENMLLKKEILILKRNMGKKRTQFKKKDKLFFVLLFLFFQKIKDNINIIKPETLIKWKNDCIKNNWSFPHSTHKVGRPQTAKWIKEVILDIKNSNLYWGYGKIQGELTKSDIDLDTKTIGKIIDDFRKKGKVKTGRRWKEFIQSHLKSIYGTDFFTVDTVRNIRYYVFFIIHYECRELIQFNITTNPAREFVRQQIIEFSNNVVGKSDKNVYLIHDRFPAFCSFDYNDYDITDITTSAHAPNMNSITERVIGSIRRECLNHFIILSQNQLRNIIKQYFHYHNTDRPHQGINQNIPKGYTRRSKGKIIKKPVLYGLIHNFERAA